ncbi:MAG TPA: chemotaxis protein CheB [Polyangiaceae bacterium]|nr:chemotaxis protein CheB [Polyangiaceae bacterium]
MKVLLVEDSATVAAYVISILGSERDIQLLPVATTAAAGVRSAVAQRPDVVLMDMKLPDHDGIWAIEQIMAEAPCPIVVLSGYLNSRERDVTFESLRAGAVDVLAKPTGLDASQRALFRNSLVNTVRVMSEAVVVRRNRSRQKLAPITTPTRESSTSLLPAHALTPIRYVLIGGSTGGPELLYRMLSALPAPFRLPILITQHTLEGFDDSLAQWLSTTGHDVKLAKNGELPKAGTVRLAPADASIKVGYAGLSLVPSPKAATASMDSIDSMLSSAARVWGDQCLAMVLTGMGRDGAAGMRTLCERGALTIAQSSQTCVVASMPESARAVNAIKYVLSPEEMLGVLRALAER